MDLDAQNNRPHFPASQNVLMLNFKRVHRKATFEPCLP